MKKLMVFSLLTLLLSGIVLSARPVKAASGTSKKVTSFAETAPVAVSGEETAEKTEKVKDTSFYVKRIIAAAVIGLLAALITVAIMKSGMNNVTRARSASDYVVKDSFQLTQSKDRYISTAISKEKRTN